jgi:hypothetical protein
LPPVPTLTGGTKADIISSAKTNTLWFFNGVAIAGTKDLAVYTPTKTGQYVVQYTDPVTQCSSKSLPYAFKVGVADLLNENQFKVYPNPMEENLSVALVDVVAATDLSITNILGQKVFTQTVTNASASWSIDITSWAKGAYFVNIMNKKGEIIGARKVIKM